VSAASVLGVFLLGAVLTGCAPEPGPSTETDPPATSSGTPTPSATAGPDDEDDGPSILQVPEVTDNEIARALFSIPDDTWTSPNTIEEAVVSGEPLLLEGACIGESARYQIRSAVPDDAGTDDSGADDSGAGDDTAEGSDAAEGADDAEAGEVLRTGILRCNEALYTELSLMVDGPVQLSFVATDDIDEGWLVLTRTGETE
jgi:hypothetical protein